MEIGGGLLFIISSSIDKSRQDGWISLLLASLFSVMITYMVTRLSRIYPNQTFVEYTQTIAGKWLGIILLVPYFVYWYTALAINLRQFAELTTMLILPRASMAECMLPLLLLVFYVTAFGIESIGRCSEVVGPLMLVMTILILLLIVPDIHVRNVLPIFTGTGPRLIFQGSLPSVHFLAEGYLMIMLVKFMKKPEEATKKAAWAVGLSGVIIAIATLFSIALFGPTISSRLWYPFFQLVRYISVLGFIQGIEPVIIAIWMCSVFIKVSLYLFITSYGTAQLFGIQSWRRVLLIAVAAGLVLAFIPRNNVQSSVWYPSKFALPIMFPLCDILIPLVLWGIVLVRRKHLPSS